MSTAVLHLPLAAAPMTAPFSRKLADAFITSCMLLDLEPFAALTDQADVFEDMPVREFLDHMQELFIQRRRELACPVGYRFLSERGSGTCVGCSGGKAQVVTFRYATPCGKPLPSCNLAYRMVWEEGILLNIFQCFFYKQGCPDAVSI